MNPFTTKPGMRFVIEYQMMGDMEGVEWANLVLSAAHDEGLIEGYSVAGAHPGLWGIELVQFTIDVGFDDERFPTDISWEDAKERGTDLANEIVHDTDAECRWVSPIALPLTRETSMADAGDSHDSGDSEG